MAQRAADSLDLELAPRARASAAWWLERIRWKIGAAFFLGWAELQPGQTSPREQCSPAGTGPHVAAAERAGS